MKYAIITEGNVKAIQKSTKWEKIDIFHTWWNKLAMEANCFLGDIKTKVTELSVSSIFQHSRSYTKRFIWGLSTFYVSRIISPKWAESYCYKINRKSKICSSDCKYGISFIHKYFIIICFFFFNGSIPSLKFCRFCRLKSKLRFSACMYSRSNHISLVLSYPESHRVNVRATILSQFFLIKKNQIKSTYGIMDFI